MSAPEPLATLSARLDVLLNDAYAAWEAALTRGGPDVVALAALHDGLQKTQWRMRATGAPAGPPNSAALPLFPEKP